MTGPDGKTWPTVCPDMGRCRHPGWAAAPIGLVVRIGRSIADTDTQAPP